MRCGKRGCPIKLLVNTRDLVDGVQKTSIQSWTLFKRDLAGENQYIVGTF